MTDGRSKMLVAYHEVGHAVAATLTPGHDAVQKVREGAEWEENESLGRMHEERAGEARRGVWEQWTDISVD